MTQAPLTVMECEELPTVRASVSLVLSTSTPKVTRSIMWVPRLVLYPDHPAFVVILPLKVADTA